MQSNGIRETNETVASDSLLTLVLGKTRDLGMLVKFRLSLTVVFSAVLAYLIAWPTAERVSLVPVLVLALGGFCVAGAANALNQVLERDYDRLMKRTADRPVASGRMSISDGVLTAGLLSVAGLMLLATFNPWTALFGALALLSYAFLYTPMKRISTAAIAIGALPGALPVLIGCVAAEGQVSSLSLTLFAIQFFWQFPHFGAISWLGFEDYQQAGFRFVANSSGEWDRSIGLQGFVYALTLVPLSILPWWTGMTGLISMAIVCLLGGAYAWLSWRLYRSNERKAALALMFFSFFYLPLALMAYWLDKT
jgi:protoheme IX farnesyltransferase